MTTNSRTAAPRGRATRALLAGGLTLLSLPALALDVQVTFYAGTDGGLTDRIAGYAKQFTGTISVDDAAVAPGALALWNGGGITAVHFDVPGASGTTYHFDLGPDLFPPLSNTAAAVPTYQGLLFDAAGKPQRIDIPASGYCSGCPPIKDTGVATTPYLEFIDDDAFDVVVRNNGFLDRIANLPAGEAPSLVFAGAWKFSPIYLTGGGADAMTGFYTLDAVAAAVPEPHTVAMMLAGLGGLAAVVRRRRKA